MPDPLRYRAKQGPALSEKCTQQWRMAHQVPLAGFSALQRLRTLDFRQALLLHSGRCTIELLRRCLA